MMKKYNFKDKRKYKDVRRHVTPMGPETTKK